MEKASWKREYLSRGFGSCCFHHIEFPPSSHLILPLSKRARVGWNSKQWDQHYKCTTLSKCRDFLFHFSLPITFWMHCIMYLPNTRLFVVIVQKVFPFCSTLSFLLNSTTFSKLISNTTSSLKPFPITNRIHSLASHSHFLYASINYFLYQLYKKKKKKTW